MTQQAAPVFDRRFALLGQGGKIGRGQIALVPGAAVPLMQFDLPEAVTGYNREQVARRQMKDRMGLPESAVEMRPFAVRGQATWLGALISERAQVDSWRDAAGGARALLPDYLGLPTCAGLWTIAAGAADGHAVRCGPSDGFGARAAMLVPLLSERLRADAPPQAVLALGPLPGDAQALFAAHDVPVLQTVAEVAAHDGLAPPETLGHGELSLDLLQNPALIRTRLRRSLRAWVTPLVLAAIGAGLWIGANVTETRRLADERRTIAAATQEIVRARFVPEGPILDVRAQVSARLSALQSSDQGTPEQSDALDLFARASTVLAGRRLTLVDVASADGATLDLVVDVADFAAADSLQSALAAEGLNVALIEARVNAGDGGVRTTLAITGGAGE